MSRQEWFSTIVSTVFGGLLSVGAATLREPHAGLWPAAIVGAVVGLVGGATGQNFIEGCFIAVVCLLGAFLVILRIPWPWIREVCLGWGIGAGVGWFAHGLFTDLFPKLLSRHRFDREGNHDSPNEDGA